MHVNPSWSQDVSSNSEPVRDLQLPTPSTSTSSVTSMPIPPLPSPSPNISRKRKRQSDLAKFLDGASQSIASISSTVAKPQMDRFDHFGAQIADQIRIVTNTRTQNYIMFKINELLYQTSSNENVVVGNDEAIAVDFLIE